MARSIFLTKKCRSRREEAQLLSGQNFYKVKGSSPRLLRVKQVKFNMKTYQHTQSAAAIVAGLGAMMLIFAIMAVIFRPLIIGIVTLGISIWIFRSMTIEVTDTELVWYFGSGFPQKRVSLSEVVSAEVIQTSFLNGWGIHYTSRGWLYNVSGYRAVAVTMRNGKRFCLGTDEPEKLAGELMKKA